MFSNQRQPIDWDEVGAKLKEKGALKPCPRCGQSKFTYVGEIDLPLAPSPIPRALPGPSYIPSIAIGCDNCGYIMHHAIRSLMS